MSKYYKADDVIDTLAEQWHYEATMEYPYAADDIEEWKENARELFADLPTIEVSEDCISRKWLEEHKEVVSYKNEWHETEIDEFVSWENIENAPSVVPSCQKNRTTTEPQKIGYCNECKWFRDKQVCGRCRSKNLYAPKDEPTAEQSSKVGEWITEDYYHNTICSNCGAKETEFIYGTENWYGVGESKFCPNCGAKMKGAEDEAD